jgi:hypothetical protein
VLPGAVYLNCLRCERRGQRSCLGVLWIDREELARWQSEGRVRGPIGPWWRLNTRNRQRISSKHWTIFRTTPHGVADVTCPRCKRPVTLSAKALRHRVDEHTTSLLV